MIWHYIETRGVGGAKCKYRRAAAAAGPYSGETRIDSKRHEQLRVRAGADSVLLACFDRLNVEKYHGIRD